MMDKLTTKHYFLAIIIVSMLWHWPFFSRQIQGVHNIRQSQTMWNVRNFVRHDFNILNPRLNSFNGGRDNIERVEFPIMQWTMAAIHKILGSEHIRITRAYMFGIGILAMFGFYRLLMLLFQHRKAALLTVFFFLCSPLYYYYIIAPIPDLFAVSGVIWYLYFFLKYQQSGQRRELIYSALCLCLATMAKVQFLMFAVVSIHFFVQNLRRGKPLSTEVKFALIQLGMVSPALAWYMWVIPQWPNNPVVYGVFSGNADFAQLWEYFTFNVNEFMAFNLLYPIVWPFFILGLVYFYRHRHQYSWVFSLMAITWLFLILELNALRKEHDYYLFPFMPWFYILVGFGIYTLAQKANKYVQYVTYILLLGTPVLIYFQCRDRWSLDRTWGNLDFYIHQKQLKAVCPNDTQCIILNDPSNLAYGYAVDKMGHVFRDDGIQADWVSDMIINRNVRYFYSDSRKIDQDTAFTKYFETKVVDIGTVHVYKLKDKETLKGQ